MKLRDGTIENGDEEICACYTCRGAQARKDRKAADDQLKDQYEECQGFFFFFYDMVVRRS